MNKNKKRIKKSTDHNVVNNLNGKKSNKCVVEAYLLNPNTTTEALAYYEMRKDVTSYVRSSTKVAHNYDQADLIGEILKLIFAKEKKYNPEYPARQYLNLLIKRYHHNVCRKQAVLYERGKRNGVVTENEFTIIDEINAPELIWSSDEDKSNILNELCDQYDDELQHEQTHEVYAIISEIKWTDKQVAILNSLENVGYEDTKAVFNKQRSFSRDYGRIINKIQKHKKWSN